MDEDKEKAKWPKVTAIILLLLLFSPLPWLPFYLWEKLDEERILVIDKQNKPLAGALFDLNGENWLEHKRSNAQGMLSFSKSKTETITLTDHRYPSQTWKTSELPQKLIVISPPFQETPQQRQQEQLLNEVVNEMMSSWPTVDPSVEK